MPAAFRVESYKAAVIRRKWFGSGGGEGGGGGRGRRVWSLVEEPRRRHRDFYDNAVLYFSGQGVGHQSLPSARYPGWSQSHRLCY